MKRDEVLRKIEPICTGTVRDVPDSNGARIIVTPDMVEMRPRRGAQTVVVQDVPQLLHFVGLPLSLQKMLHPDTFGRALSEVLEKQGRYSMVVKDDKLASIVPYGERKAVNPERLLDTVEKIIPVDSYLRVMLEGQMATIEVVGDKTDFVVKGDNVSAGVMLGFSPMGVDLPWVQAYALRRWCTNGATTNTVLAKFTAGGGSGGGEGDNIWQFFRASIRKAYNAFGELVAGWRELAGEEISPEDRGRMVEALIKKSQLPEKIANAIRAKAMETPPQNSWEVLNLLTFASTHLMEKLPPKQIRRALQVTADFGDEDTHDRTCPLCHHKN